MKPAFALTLAGLVACACACQGASSKTAPKPALKQAPPGADVPLTHCLEAEQVVFSCKLQHNVASICATSAGEGIRYLMGPAGAPELLLDTSGAEPAGVLRRSHLAFAGSTGGYAYSFVRNATKFIVYAISGDGDLQEAGVVTHPLHSPNQARHLGCEGGSLVETDDIRLIKRTLSLPEDPDLKRGVPGLGK
jgi:hypothetical protein